MKRVFIVHRWEGTPESDWYPWLTEQYRAKGYQVIVPQMPHTEAPEINSWVTQLQKVVGVVDENTYFVGHSIGCQTILRFLQTQNNKIGGAVFVAPWFKLKWVENEDVAKIAKPWEQNPIDFDILKKVLQNVYVILSTNDPFVDLEGTHKAFEQKLGIPTFIIKENCGHFTSDDGITQLPEAI